jgi:hypothetical protein
MRLRRYELSAAMWEQFIAAALDCAKAAGEAAREGKDAEQVRHFAEAARTLLDSGEVHISPVEVDCFP